MLASITAKWTTTEFAWEAFAFVGQVVFGMRFIIQWIASERHKRSVVPVAFWYLSVVGSTVLLVYAIHLGRPVLIAGFSLNMLIYFRNLYFIHRHRGPAEPATAAATDAPPPHDGTGGGAEGTE
ncbi:MAG: lipid-A-disaccharide synthase N-terminal domain-containing protein [Planctomycetes bacterium]|nr:lipid-A-disaccharide synthase N-terminal domain-containing protein [Planctomycetota bacterium]